MRMIDADALKEQFRQTYRFSWNGKDHKRLTEEKQLIDNAPTIDAVPVVRCRDCKYRVRSEGVCAKLSNNYEPPVYCDEDDYCSMGVRRGGT